MIVGILGGTNLSIALGNRLTSRGVDVIYGVREDFDSNLFEWKILRNQTGKVVSYCEAIQKAEIVMLCCENDHLPQVVNCMVKKENKDKIIIDCTNGQYCPELGCNTTYIQKKAKHKKIFKAFNNLGLNYPQSDNLGMIKETYFCGDDPLDKIRVKRLIEFTGFKAIDAGKLKNAFLLEAFYHLRNEIIHSLPGAGDFHFKLLSV
ncbi:NADPH-dependent F420 reductase [Pararhodonellum marinum]|uniref:NADPH-dependent F420 reductase n=1 Tax=Pararhodonellum marinum TaxID=2755358 RepID=UPI00188F06A4|nr:NAD(P)-binding domain-containing protein [Pararhodonellum marinum]